MHNEQTIPETPISIEIYSDYILKRYNVQSGDFVIQGEKFQRELSAYKKFSELKVDFVPELVSFDEKLLSLTIERIGGPTLCELLESCSEYDLDSIIEQIIDIDSFLSKNRINCLYISPADFIYQKVKKRLYIIDFEYTYVNRYFQQILLDQMFHPRIQRVKNTQCRDKFLNLLTKKKKDIFRYRSRKVLYYLSLALGFQRKK